MTVAGIFHRPFEEQLKYFRQKLNLGTEHWDDIRGNAHDRAFIVAGAMKADLLTDLRGAVDEAIAEGTTLETFRRDFAKIVEKHGWSYRGGFDWRTRVIYETNLRASYQAGRWAQLNDADLARVAPYWRYKHSDSVLHPRPLHVAWDGLTLPRTDAWWQTHFPPNGWGCKCRVVAVRAKELPHGQPDTAPDDGTYTHVDRRGVAHVIPKGVDYGWAHAPGERATDSLRGIVADKLVRYPDAISTLLSRDVNRYVNATDKVGDYVARVLADPAPAAPLWLGFVENAQQVGALLKREVRDYLVLLPDDAVRHVERSHAFDGGSQRPPTADDFAHVWEVLAQPDTLRLGEVSRQGLATVVASKKIGAEVLRCVFEVRPGKNNRALALMSLVVKR